MKNAAPTIARISQRRSAAGLIFLPWVVAVAGTRRVRTELFRSQPARRARPQRQGRRVPLAGCLPFATRFAAWHASNRRRSRRAVDEPARPLSPWARLGLLAFVLSLAAVSGAVTARTSPAAPPCTPLHTRLGLHRRRPRRARQQQGRLGERRPRLVRRPDLRGDPPLPAPADGRRPARGAEPEAPDRLGRLLPRLRTAARDGRRRRGTAPRRRREPDRLAARQRTEPDGPGRPPCARALRHLPLAPDDPAPRRRIPADPRDLVRRREGRPLPAGVVRGRGSRRRAHWSASCA